VFARVTVTASDLDASAAFYGTLLAALDAGTVAWPDFELVPATPERRVTRRLHVAFGASSRAAVDAAWAAVTAAGHPDDGAPGPRPEYGPDYYGGFLRDPDGNSAEAVHHAAVPGAGLVDHLWLRVADVAASRRFWLATMQDVAGMRAGTDEPDRFQVRMDAGSFSLVTGGAATQHAALAFRAAAPGAAGRRTDPDGNEVDLLP
jgi:catechol 2,3-dioxygenase-like lactoylglutathione lyase family enzyme